MKHLKRMSELYKYLLGILFKEAPVVVTTCFVFFVVSGLVTPLVVYVNSNIFDTSLLIAQGYEEFTAIIPLIILYAIALLLPRFLNLYIFSYAEQHCLLILRTVLKEKMLNKLKKMKYAHLENPEAIEVIEKSTNRAENSARHLFPMYMKTTIESVISATSLLVLIISIKWWLIFPVLIPFVIETYVQTKSHNNIYLELESYYQKEKQYHTLEEFLKSRNYINENRFFQASEYLIDIYQKRFRKRNKEYEAFFFKHLKSVFVGSNITRIAAIINTLLLLYLYLAGEVSIGLFITVTVYLCGELYSVLSYAIIIPLWGGFHANFFDYYKKYFELEEDNEGTISKLPRNCTIEFKDVWFRYPNTDRDILKGLSFVIKDGEKVSIVGENGEGKSTMIKLLLGLFTPDKGEILIGGKPLLDYNYEVRCKMFGTVFQDFTRYSLTLKENVALGDIEKLDDEESLLETMKKTRITDFSGMLELGVDTLLGRDFENGIDLSGGQWQRIAMARAFLGDKPILILDEPTSQLDPMAESSLYAEFGALADHKTALFITHRLGSTAITDRILVISNGVVAQVGTHEELLKVDGLYSKMFNIQRSWYEKGGDSSGR